MSIKDYEGGIITKNPTTPTGPYQDGVASGVWTMDQAAEYTKQGVWPTAGNISPEQYVDALFSTYLYEGTGAAQSITNGIDFAGKGGMLWIKDRDSGATNQYITDTERSLAYLRANSSAAQVAHTATYDVTALNSDGFSVGLPNEGVNTNGNSNVSWSFLKKPGFFDVVTFEAPSSPDTNYRISHNLGSAPGTILLKNVDNAYQWYVYHRSDGRDKYIVLNTANGSVSSTGVWGTSDPTSTDFGVNANNTGTRSVDVGSGTYIAYLFAHDDQRFGDNSDQSIIKCGSYTGNGSVTGPTVNLGWEPQWLLIKRSDAASDGWVMVDIMRGLVVGGNDNYLYANSTNAEASAVVADLNATGFQIKNAWGGVNASGGTYIYIAIRRPMMTPTAATEVFELGENRTSIGNQTIGTIGPIDMCMSTQVPTPYANYHWAFTNRLIGGSKYLASAYTQAEATAYQEYDTNTGVINGSWFTSGGLWYNFKRATGFFDMVAYTGDGGTTQTLNHNLGVTPELMIAKRRNDTQNWVAYHSSNGAGKYYNPNTTAGVQTLSTVWGGVEPTSTQFTVGNSTTVNFNGDTYIAYLFATLAGISKVGSYSGTGSNVDVDCGFTAGARLILIKRTDSTGDWYVWDSVRGIVSGNDPYLLLNSTATEVTGTDYIDPLSSGFTVTSSAPAGLNASGGTYIFLAIA